MQLFLTSIIITNTDTADVIGVYNAVLQERMKCWQLAFVTLGLELIHIK